MKQNSRVKIIIPFFLSLVFTAAAPTLTGKVVGVSDGDTITILVNKKQYKIRLHGIDTPERRQAFGTKAKQFTSSMIFGDTVTVRTHGEDLYGRIIGEVVSDGRNLNRALVASGLAWWYRKYAPGGYGPAETGKTSTRRPGRFVGRF
ncbi:MAG: thermonuclease family protein [Chitinispirillaceae bacterium]